MSAGAGEERASPRAVVTGAIRTLAANRLRRGVPPLALLFVYGVAGAFVFRDAFVDYLLLALGALLSVVALVSVAVRAILRARGRGRRSWLGLSHVLALLPGVYGAYLLFFRGLRALARLPASWLLPAAEATAFVVLGLWVLRVTWKLFEVGRLAGAMAGSGEGSE